MIDHLKDIHRVLYLPAAPESEELPFKVTPINEPYLYTDANIYVDTFDNPNQSVKVMVSNVGDGKLRVERIRIPRGFEKWIKRAEGSKPATLTSTSDPLELELKLNLRTLPNPSSENIVKLSILSNSKRKTFSEILLRVQPPCTQSTNLTLPEYINFGEITTYKVLLLINVKMLRYRQPTFCSSGILRLTRQPVLRLYKKTNPLLMRIYPHQEANCLMNWTCRNRES